MSTTPLAYLEAAGRRAESVLPLTWMTLIISIVVCVVIGVLLWMAVRRAQPGGAAETRLMPVERGAEGTRWISLGLLISAVPLLATLIWTMVALAATSGPPRNPALVMDVTGHQWWWEVHYDAADPSQQFSTANEIHIPVGLPVLVRLHGGDVIHSFWVPKLTGKTDTIPGQTNYSWIEAAHAGRYRGQCGEYCGLQHAHMALEVVAEPEADFERWRAQQLQPAPAPQSPAQSRGLELVQYRCGLCHRIGGTQAGAISAPDLTHVMGRRMLAAGTLLNNPGNLSGWIEDPQQIKPGSLMPRQYLSAQQLADVRAYLELLK
ncbi:MAG TPA: cytochrome c oxidase subunit II [Steroidobacteraceae bacterium]